MQTVSVVTRWWWRGDKKIKNQTKMKIKHWNTGQWCRQRKAGFVCTPKDITGSYQQHTNKQTNTFLILSQSFSKGLGFGGAPRSGCHQNPLRDILY